ncbi:MAG TPA: phage integrase SAM-like domain-containing protein, partial [Rhodothermales bacterium]|nr:phage integrase SAM-like domain-containing protein [Rhodothermales bacterium]
MPVRFYLEHRSGYPATRPVTLTLFVRRHRAHKLKIATPFRVEPRHWSVPLGRLKPSAPGATDVNAALLELRAFTESLVALGASDDDVRERVKERFGVPPRPRQPLLKDLYAEFVVWKEGQTQPSTMRTYRALQKHLEAFAPTATVADVGGDFATDFGAYLVREGHSNPNVNKLTTRVKAFLDYLVKRKLIERAEGAKPLATPRNAPLYLTLEELDTLIAADLSGLPQRHRDARDLFIAETVTGQRYSDLVAMKWEQLDLARSIWAMPVKKTPTALRVPLPPPLMRI